MSNTAKITKAKLKDELFLEVEYTEEVIVKGNTTGTRTVAETLTVPVHEDLIKAFKPLAGHLASICDEISAKKLGEVIDKYMASGFSLKGEDSSLGVTIMGGKRSKHGFFSINTPYQRFESSKYVGISELGIVIETCKHEVLQYLFEGKKAPDPQLDLFNKSDAATQEGSQEEMTDIGNAAGKSKTSKGKMKIVKDEPATAAAPAPEKPEKKKRPARPKKNKDTEF